MENVFKIASNYSSVRKFLESKGWEFQGEDEEMEMGSFRDTRTRSRLFVEDITDDFPVTFLMGGLTLAEFQEMAGQLTSEIKILVVESSWEGKPTTVIVAMTEDQVRKMFGRRTRMRELAVRSAAQET